MEENTNVVTNEEVLEITDSLEPTTDEELEEVDAEVYTPSNNDNDALGKALFGLGTAAVGVTVAYGIKHKAEIITKLAQKKQERAEKKIEKASKKAAKAKATIEKYSTEETKED